jgi:hypothetical protein
VNKSKIKRQEFLKRKIQQKKARPNMKEEMKNILLSLNELTERCYSSYRKKNNPSQLPLWRNMHKYVDLDEISRLREEQNISSDVTLSE